MVADRVKFLHRMKELKPYLVEFDSTGQILKKSYSDNCQIGGLQRRSTILIIHDESIFSANDGKKQAWIKKYDIFIRSKGKGQEIMVSDFLLSWSQLNLKHLTEAELTEAKKKDVPLKTVKLFEYSKQEGY